MRSHKGEERHLNKVEQFFDSYAGDFDAIYGTERSLMNSVLNPILRKSMRTRFDRTLLYTRPMTGKTALDLGCGPGHYATALASDGAERVVGIDFSQEMIRIARDRASSLGHSDRCDFVVEDILEYTPSERFDFSIAMGVMDYIDGPDQMIGKTLSLTREKAFFSFPTSRGLLALQRRIRYLSRCPLYLYSRSQLNALLGEFTPHEYEIEDIGRDFFVTVSIR